MKFATYVSVFSFKFLLGIGEDVMTRSVRSFSFFVLSLLLSSGIAWAQGRSSTAA